MVEYKRYLVIIANRLGAMNKTLADILRIIILLCLIVLAVFILPEGSRIQKMAHVSKNQQMEIPGSVQRFSQPTSEKSGIQFIFGTYLTHTWLSGENQSNTGRQGKWKIEQVRL